MYEKMVQALERYDADVVSSAKTIDKPEVIQQDLLQKYLVVGDVNMSNKLFRINDFVREQFRFPGGDVSIDVKGCFDMFRHARRWVRIPGAYYNFRQDNISYGRSGFSPVDLNTTDMARMICRDAEEISREVYDCAYLHVLHSEFNVINKVAIYGFKKPEFQAEYEKVRKQYVKDLRKHILSALRTEYFHKSEKVQLLVLAVSYHLFMAMKKRYVEKHRDDPKVTAIQC